MSENANHDLDRAVAWLAEALAVPAPFPWQEELLKQMLAGERPSLLDIPTGLGKTAFIAIWLVARACGADVPRRLVYVVDRRAVIDQATEVVGKLRDKVQGWVAADPTVAEYLGLAPGAKLPVSTLRGQLADNREWLANPATSAIVLGTIDMIGSRLLFEGYGVSRRMRPYHAGLLGADVLVALDEAHLVPAFETLVRTVAGDASLRPSDTAERAIIPLLAVTSLSATSRGADERVFALTPRDREHVLVRKRLDAKKCVIVREAIDFEKTTLADALAGEAWRCASERRVPVRVIVYCNLRDVAQKTQEAIRRLGAIRKKAVDVPTPQVELFVGGRRVYERNEAASWLRERGFIAGYDAKPNVPTFLVATSAGEVGVDLDADHMVCDVVAWERMVQRLGRVNRRGDGEAQVVVVPEPPDKKERDALKKAEDERNPEERRLARAVALRDATVALMARLPVKGAGRDASPGALVALRNRASSEPELTELMRRASTDEPLCPALTRPLVEAWSMTSLEQHAGRPEVAPWIRGWTDDEPQTSIVWRDVLPATVAGAMLPRKQVEAFFEAAAPHTLEVLETETHRAAEWLIERLDAVRKSKSWRTRADVTDEPAGVIEVGEGASDGEHEGVEDQADAAVEQPAVARRELRARDVVAFILSAGDLITGVRGDVLPDDARERKREREQLEALLVGARLVVDSRLGGLSHGLLDPKGDARALDVTTLDAGVPFRVVDTRVEEPADAMFEEEIRCAIETSNDGVATHWIAVQRHRAEIAVTEEGRSISRAQLLDAHEECAEKWACRLADRLNLPKTYAEVLALAARLHDEGKRAARWQRAFRAPQDGVYGKTTSRPNLQLLDGYRHEFGSLPYAEKDPRVAALPPDLRELCLHLIAAHHGRARLTIPTDGCEDAPPSALVKRAQQVAMRFARLEKRWGPWGLAWWEVLLRAADQLASRENDVGEAEVFPG